jgi:hypothetical protein
LNLSLAGEREEPRKHAIRSHEFMQPGRAAIDQNNKPGKNS